MAARLPILISINISLYVVNVVHMCDVYDDDGEAKTVLETGHFVKDLVMKVYCKINPDCVITPDGKSAFHVS